MGPSVVTKDGVPYRTYSYDANGNRLTASEDGATPIAATYDAQDRLTSYAGSTYSYNAAGQLASKTTASKTTTYDYDELGNLLEVDLPTKTVGYVVDGLGRRVARKVDGAVTNRYVYGQGLQPIAELNDSGGIKQQFVFASKGHVPDLMIKNGTTFRFVTDNVGSVRMVVNSSTGEVVQRIDYDPFGSVISDTNPGFQPFGFAGGLYDADTGLVRFGARDYDAIVGRWTGKDRVGFAAGDPNLYVYVQNDPINFVDPSGNLLIPIGVLAVVALVDAALTISDAISTTSTVLDPCASAGDKFLSGGLFILGLALPGIGGGSTAARVADDVFDAVDDLSAAARAIDRNHLTGAGRALQKHGDRPGSVFPATRGSASQMNAVAQDIVDDILTAPGSRAIRRPHGQYGEVIDIIAEDGRGVRYTADGRFIGFLEPPR